MFCFFLLPFSEMRIIRYELFGPRSISPSDILFILFCFALLIHTLSKNRLIYVVRSVKPGWYIFGAGLVLILYNLSFIENSLQYTALRPFLLIGVMVFMILSFFVFIRLKENRIFMLIHHYATIIAIFYLFLLILIRLSMYQGTIIYKEIFYGEGTPAFHFPFASPGQAALFGALILMLGAGAALTIRKHYILYLIVPVMILSIAQSGSRSVMFLLVYAWVSFILFQFTKIKSQNHDIKPLLHLLLSTCLAAILLFTTMDVQGKRSISFLSVPITNLITGKADPFRDQVWHDALKEQADEQVVDYNTVGTHKEQADEQVVDYNTVGTHNIYLEFLLLGGKLSFVLFVIFLLSLLVPVIILFLRNRGSPNQPMYSAMLLGLIIILGEMYAYPVLHLRFIWVFFGLVVAILFIEHKRSSIGKS